MKTRCFLGRVVVLSFLLVFLPGFGHPGAEECETPTNVKAPEILPANLISGPFHRIKDTVVSHGYMYRYTVVSDLDVFEATGNGALRKLLREIPAIASLRKVSETEAFAKSLGKAALKPLKLGEGLITDPVDTVSGIPKGVYHLFSYAYTSATGKRNPAEDSQVEQTARLFVLQAPVRLPIGRGRLFEQSCLAERVKPGCLGFGGCLSQFFGGHDAPGGCWNGCQLLPPGSAGQ